MPPNPPSNSRLPRLAVWSGYGTVLEYTENIILSKLPDKATRDDREKARENTICLVRRTAFILALDSPGRTKLCRGQAKRPTEAGGSC